jgi:hypothetical protein
MRIIVYQKAQICFLSLIVLLLVINSVSTPIVSAQNEPALIIEIDDSNTENEIIENTIFEGKNYDVIVNTRNETGPIFDILGVNISFLGVSYNTSTEFVTLQAPLYEKYKSFNITATKDGYLKAELEITVIKGKLSIVADRGTIEEKKEFQVAVKDQDNKPVANASVYVTPEANPVKTDIQGVAYVLAPDVEIATTETIQVNKSGYFPGSTNIRIENTEGFAFDLTDPQFLQILPILIAVLVVIFAIVYVLWRQKRTPMIQHQTTRVKPAAMLHTYQQENQQQRLKNKPTIFSEEQDVSISAPQSRVEEIRISAKGKKKNTSISSEVLKSDPVPENQKKEQNEWFKGQDYLRYKIDELTGEIDQNTDGKWFEGKHDIKYKVDEALKKNLKKKKVDEENIK